MNKTKFFSILICALIVSNLILIFTVLRKPHPHPGHLHPGAAKHIVIDKLHFDNAQVEKYESLIHWHRSHIDDAQHKIMSLKATLYHTLQNRADSTPNAKIIDSIGKIQMEILEVINAVYPDLDDLRDVQSVSDLQ